MFPSGTGNQRIRTVSLQHLGGFSERLSTGRVRASRHFAVGVRYSVRQRSGSGLDSGRASAPALAGMVHWCFRVRLLKSGVAYAGFLVSPQAGSGRLGRRRLRAAMSFALPLACYPFVALY